MKLLLDILPVLFFFIVYKISGIYVATAAAIFISALQMIYTAVFHKRVDFMQAMTLVLLIILGGATISLHNEWFIKLKPTVINIAFALVFFFSEYVGKKKTLIERMMPASPIDLPGTVWRTLNRSWIVFFLTLAAINLYVIYHYDTNTWVNFKLFGMLGLTVIFAIGQAVYLGKYALSQASSSTSHQKINS